MDLMTVSCIVLLTESSEEGGDSEGNGGSLSRSRLEVELEEMGLGDSSRLEMTLQRMAQAGYIDVDGKQRVVAEKPTISMARLLDHAFPGMPGMNLVAYFVQTMDEVETGRKNPDGGPQVSRPDTQTPWSRPLSNVCSGPAGRHRKGLGTARHGPSPNCAVNPASRSPPHQIAGPTRGEEIGLQGTQTEGSGCVR